MPEVLVTTVCTPEPDAILLPQQTAPIPLVVVWSVNGRRILLHGGVRGDPGQGACVSGTVRAKLGGDDTTRFTYRAATRWDVLVLKPGVLLQLLLALIALALAVLSGYATWDQARGGGAGATPFGLATAILVLTVVGAAAKCWSDTGQALQP